MIKKIFLLIFIFSNSILNTYCQLSEKNERNAKVAYNTGVENITSSNFQEAFSNLNLCLELDPGNFDAKLALAKVEIELNMPDKALSDFISLIFDNPSNGELWFYKGYLSFNGVADSSVLESFNKSVSFGFSSPDVYYYRGLSKHLTGDYKGAVADYTLAIEQTNDFALAYHDRGTAKRYLGDMQGALYDYRMSTSFKHDFPVAFNNMGSVKIILGDYEGAVQDYSVAIKLDSSFAIAYNNRGAAKFYLGNIQEALMDFEKSVNIEKTYLPAINNKASALVKENKYNEALMLFDGIIAVSDKQGTAYLNRGLLRELTGDLSGACSDWSKALNLGIEEAARYIKECK